MENEIFIMFQDTKDSPYVCPFQALVYKKDPKRSDLYHCKGTMWIADSISELKLKMLIEAGHDKLYQFKKKELNSMFFESIGKVFLDYLEEA